MSQRILAVGLACLVFGSAPAFASFIVDGDLSDWGVTVADNNNSVFGFSTAFSVLGTHLEDQNDNAGDGGALGPNQGGQNYDAEMMAVAVHAGHMYVAVVTGQRPDNGFTRYAPGDIRIETDAGSYGLEVGGGPGGGDGTLLSTGAFGSTYTLKGNGYTLAHAYANERQTVGSIWGEVTWLMDPINPKEPTQFEITNASEFLGEAEYIYTRDSDTAQHAVIEFAFDLSLFAGQTLESIHWRPSCGNDELDVAVPEPGALASLLLGGLALVIRRR